MFGLMQDWPLLCHRIIEQAAAIHGHQGPVLEWLSRLSSTQRSVKRA
jgi:hypothetical protein